MISKETMVEVFQILHACYPAIYRNMSMDTWKKMFAVWYALFQNTQFSKENILDAAQEYVMGENSRIHPTPGEIAELARLRASENHVDADSLATSV